MKIIITDVVKDCIRKMGRKDKQINALKVWALLYSLDERKRPNGYFDVPSRLLKKVYSRYEQVIDYFIESNIIKYQTNMKTNPNDPLFGSPIYSKNYSTSKGQCMKYKILIDLTNGEEIEVDITPTKSEKWFDKIKYSLNVLGFDDKISRDTFGRRVHYNTLYHYKQLLANKGLYVIDAVCSQPRLLYNIMKQKNIYDKNYYDIFENNKDFYLYMAKELGLKDDATDTARRKAKDLFMYWCNSNGYVPNVGIYQLFPNTSNFLKSLKSSNYKDASSFLQREESKIWIDDILINCPTKFALPVHDSIIVNWEDAQNIKDWCQERYPNIKFEMKEL